MEQEEEACPCPMRKKPQKNYHQPGYVPPIRCGKRAVVAYVDPHLFDAMREITQRDGHTIQTTVEGLCRAYVRSDGKALLNLDHE
jgi:hypothetical protein